jgi:bacterioferritin-associated ferredoxin
LYVCICNGITERQVRESARQGANSMDALAFELGVGTCCGRCRDCAAQLLQDETGCPGHCNSLAACA